MTNPYDPNKEFGTDIPKPSTPNPPMPPSAIDPNTGMPRIVNPPTYSEINATSKKSTSKIVIVIVVVIIIGAVSAGIGFYFVGKSTKSFDVVNRFYKTAKNGGDMSSQTCNYTNGDINADELMDLYEQEYGEVKSYNFNSLEITNGHTLIKGEVTREKQKLYSAVEVETINGIKKVCGVYESTQAFSNDVE